VEGDAEAGVVALVIGRRRGDELLGRDAVLARADHDGRAVAVLGTHVDAVVAARPLEAAPDVGLHRLDHVPKVQRAVRVRQRAGDENPAFLAQPWSFTASKRDLAMAFL